MSDTDGRDRDRRTGRLVVLSASVVAVGLLVQLLVMADTSIYRAVMESAGAWIVALGVLSIGEQVWHGSKISHFNTPAGGLTPDTAKAAEDATEEVNDGLAEGILELAESLEWFNDRLYNIEKRVFDDEEDEGSRSRRRWGRRY